MKTKKKKIKAKARVTKPKARAKAKSKKKVKAKKKVVVKKKVKRVVKVKKVKAKPKAKAKKRKGFTLIEMLIVIAIIGVLATVVLVAVTNARKKSNATQARVLIQQFSTAQEMYLANGCPGTSSITWPAAQGSPVTDCNGEVIIARAPIAGNNFTANVNAFLNGGLTFSFTGTNANTFVYSVSGFNNGGVFTCSRGACYCSDTAKTGCTSSL